MPIRSSSGNQAHTKVSAPSVMSAGGSDFVGEADGVKRGWRILMWACTAVLLLLSVSSFIAASHVYDLSGRWFARATYITQCTPVPIPPTSVGDCAVLAREPPPPYADGVPVMDKEILLTDGSTMHSVGTALVTIAGLFIAASTLCVGVLALCPRAASRSDTSATTA
jgi:hypothetical protein